MSTVSLDEIKLRHGIISYLIFQGYTDTANIIAKEWNIAINTTGVHHKQNVWVQENIITGKIDNVIQFMRSNYKKLLDDNFAIKFQLYSLVFINLLKDEKRKEALTLAQTELATIVSQNTLGLMDSYKDLMTLFCYQSLDNCPFAHLASDEYRESVSNSINEALLIEQGLPSSTPLVQIIQQLTVAKQQLHDIFKDDSWTLEDLTATSIY